MSEEITVNLKDFCGHKGYRWEEPLSDGVFDYATDGYICIRVPTSGAFEVGGDKDMHKLKGLHFPDGSEDGFMEPLRTEEPLDTKCTECWGDGEVWHDCGCEFCEMSGERVECGFCEGSGKVENSNRVPLLENDKHLVFVGAAHKIASLPEVKVRFSTLQDWNAFQIIFKGGCGVAICYGD